VVAATTAACVRRKKYARRRPSVSHRVTRRVSQKTTRTRIRREFRSIARVNPRPPGRRRRRRGFDRSRARERVETIRNISFRRVRPVSRAFARVVAVDPSSFPNPRYSAIDRSIVAPGGSSVPRHDRFRCAIRRRIRPHRPRAYLLDVLEGRHSLGLDGLLRDGRLGDDADAREGGGCERHDDVVRLRGCV